MPVGKLLVSCCGCRCRGAECILLFATVFGSYILSRFFGVPLSIVRGILERFISFLMCLVIGVSYLGECIV